MKKINAVSLFSGGGIGETYFNETGVQVKVANELLENRANFYQHTHPESTMIQGDIQDPEVYDAVIQRAKEAQVSFVLATPPCQGMSSLGKKDYEVDQRNSLVHYALTAIDDLNPDYVMIENVPKFVKIPFDAEGYVHRQSDTESPAYKIDELLELRYGSEYNIDMKVLNAKFYGVPQSRSRAIIRMYKKGLHWGWPDEEPIITMREAIGDLPSLESGEDSGIKWHKALIHNKRQVEALSHTPEGKSAMKNEVFYPKKADGSRVKGFHNTYNRMKWDEPAPAITTNSQVISGHNNVHPGHKLANGLWSDARALTLREVMILSSLPVDWPIDGVANERLIREMIGEAVPPLLSKKIIEEIFKE